MQQTITDENTDDMKTLMKTLNETLMFIKCNQDIKLS